MILRSGGTWTLAISVVGLLAAPALAESPDEVIASLVEVYGDLPELAERIDYTVHLPDGRAEEKAIEYGRSGERAIVGMIGGDGTRLFHLVAGDGVLRATQFNVGSAFVEVPYGESMIGAFVSAGALQVGLTVPPGLAALEGQRALVESLGFGVLRSPQPVAVEERDGSKEVHLRGEGGDVWLRVDSGTGRMRGLSMTIGEGESTVRLEGEIKSVEIPDTDERWSVAVDGRDAVADFATLESSVFPLGEAAPDLELPSLDGEVISLAALRGQVVILDFWATWCIPCWSALEHLEEVARWAEDSGMPVSVWAVNTLEQTRTLTDRASLVAGFLESRGLELPVLLDVDDTFFSGMHSPGLPSTIVIGPDGILAYFHSGLIDDLANRLTAEAGDLLEER